MSPRSSIAVLAYRSAPGGGGAVVKTGGAFVVAKVPAPTEPFALQYIDTLAPEVVAEHSVLQARYPAAPHDAQWNTVYARFDIGSVLRQFSSDGPNGETAVPAPWYSGRVDPLNVKIEREEQLPDGQFGKVTVLEPIPGQIHFRAEMAERINMEVRDHILGIVADPAGRDQIIRPEFYDGKAGSWVPPVGDAMPQAGAVSDDPVKELNQRLAELEAERDRLKAMLKDQGCPEAPPAPDQPKEPKKRDRDPKGSGGGGAAPPGSGEGPSAGGGSGGALRDGGGGTKDPAKKGACQQLWKKLAANKSKIDRVQAELEKLGLTENEEPEVQEPQEVPLGDIVLIWAHDITAVPGVVYRYRMTVEVFNPLFAHKLDLMPEQQPLAEQFTLSSPPSEWSPPMMTEPPLRVFIVQATPSNVVGGVGSLPVGQATAEVYRFYDGQWWMQAFSVKPGDRVGGPREVPKTSGEPAGAKADQVIDYSTDWFVLDVIEDITVDRGDTAARGGAKVVLQSLNSPALSEFRVPKSDYVAPERRKLATDIQIAAR